ncbi:uncharacterized protein LOC135483585 [Lineus longissimus]|uniref:uncharacterized protein LOC135483585 n=4 Tax=Lineus longissimus TaxID=88925 RepID=UPI00315CE990
MHYRSCTSGVNLLEVNTCERSILRVTKAAMFAIPMFQVVALRHNRRAENFIRTPAYSGEPIERHMRLNQEQFDHLVDYFHGWRQANHQGNGQVNASTSSRRMKTFLHYLASGGFHRQVGYAVGYAKPTAILHVTEVSDFFFDIAARHISFPEQDEFDQLAQPLVDIDGVERQVILFIDGVIVKIQKPDRAGDAYYCGRPGKCCDSINVQYVVDRFGRVRHVISGVPGSTHDKTAAEWSRELFDFLDQLPEEYVMLGDPAYRNLHRSVLITFTGNNLRQEQLDFNNRCTRLRQIVERSIGCTELIWRINQLKENRYAAKYGPVFPSKCTVATCVLHNLYTNFLA